MGTSSQGSHDVDWEKVYIDNPAQGGGQDRSVLPRLRVQDCRSHMPDANFF